MPAGEEEVLEKISVHEESECANYFASKCLYNSIWTCKGGMKAVGSRPWNHTETFCISYVQKIHSVVDLECRFG